MTKDRPTTSRHHLAVFRRQGISRPFRPDSPDGTASGDSGASPPSFVFVCTLPLRRGSAPPGRAPGWPTRGEAGYSMPIGSGAASYSYRPAPAPAPAPPAPPMLTHGLHDVFEASTTTTQVDHEITVGNNNSRYAQGHLRLNNSLHDIE